MHSFTSPTLKKYLKPVIGFFALAVFVFTLTAFNLVRTTMQSQPDPFLQHKLDTIYKLTDSKKYEVAIDLLGQLIKDSEKSKNYNYLFHSYNLLSMSHSYLQDTVHALNYSRKALHYAQLSKNDTLISWAYNNLAADLSTDIKTQNQALEYYKKALDLQRKLNDGEFYDAALNLAELYYKMGDYNQMFEYLQEAQSSYNEKYDYYDDPLIYLNILWGDYYQALKSNRLALKHYNEAYERIELAQLDFIALDFYDRFAAFLVQIGKADRAYKVQQHYFEYYKNQEQLKAKETYQLAEAKLDAAEALRERNEAKMEQEVLDKDLQRKKIQSVLLGSIIVLMMLFLAYLFYSERLRLKLINHLKLKNKNLEVAKTIAEKSEQAKTRFFSTLSHEMRTPLYGVTGIISFLEKTEVFKKYEAEISSLRFSADHLLEIINDLLDISKLEDDSFKLMNKSFNIKLLVEELIMSFDQNSFKNSKCRLIYDVDSSVPNYIIGDSRRISQVLLNIIGNAIKFTPQGNVALRLRSQLLVSGKHKILFEIEDDGIGIPEEKQHLIFDEFSQLEEIDLDAKGTGLGLPIVRKLLRKMGSEISLSSIPGKGSIFKFEIIFEEATLQQVASRAKNAVDKKQSEKLLDFSSKSFLIVDDNKINRMVTKRVLENFKAQVFEASSGKEAIAMVKENDYDLILMDINMPGLNGFETTAIIREFELDLPIVALTASVENYITRKALESGMNSIITKPFNPDKFFKVISEQLSRKSAIMG